MNQAVKKQTLRRLAIAEGHLKKVRKMVEEEDYCPDIIHQSQAVQAALKKVDEITLHGHLHTCVIRDIQGTKPEKEQLVQELVELFRRREKNG